MNFRKISPDYFRNIIFGAEDSLVSTVGVLFGVASAGQATEAIVVTGLVVIVVESLSMGAGSYLTETSTHKLDAENKHTDIPFVDGIIMFLSYFVFGFIPLVPYMLLPPETAKFASVIIALVTLFILGYVPTRSMRDACRMAIVAGFAVVFGYVIATVAEHYLTS